MGCTSDGVSRFISFDRLEVQNIDFSSVDADFVFRIDNSLPIGFAIERFNYNLAFEGISWLSGDDPNGLVVFADNQSEVALPMAVVFTELYDMVQATKGEDEIDFGLSGDFGIALSGDSVVIGDSSSQAGSNNAGGAQVVDVPYAADGDFPALRTPKFSFDALNVTNASLDTLSLSLDLGVQNEHASALWFTNFDYNINVDGATVASGLVADLGSVAGVSPGASVASTGTLSLPIDIDLLSLGTGGIALYDTVMNGEALNLNMNAATDVDTPFGIVTLAIDETGQPSIQ